MDLIYAVSKQNLHGLTEELVIEIFTILANELELPILTGQVYAVALEVITQSHVMNLFLYENIWTKDEVDNGGSVKNFLTVITTWMYRLKATITANKLQSSPVTKTAQQPQQIAMAGSSATQEDTELARESMLNKSAQALSKQMKLSFTCTSVIQTTEWRDYANYVSSLDEEKIWKMHMEENLHPYFTVVILAATTDAPTALLQRVCALNTFFVNKIIGTFEQSVTFNVHAKVPHQVAKKALSLITQGQIACIDWVQLRQCLTTGKQQEIELSPTLKTNIVHRVLGYSKQNVTESLELMQVLSTLVHPWDHSVLELNKVVKTVALVNSEKVLEALTDTLSEFLSELTSKKRPHSLFSVCTVISHTEGGKEIETLCPEVILRSKIDAMLEDARDLHKIAASVDSPKFPSESQWNPVANTQHKRGAAQMMSPSPKTQRSNGIKSQKRTPIEQAYDQNILSYSVMFRNDKMKVDAQMTKVARDLRVPSHKRLCSRGVMFKRNACQCGDLHMSREWTKNEAMRFYRDVSITHARV